jgi:hypothetical protein
MMSSMNERHNLLLPILLMFLFALSRWPGLMPDNFSAAYALAFCAGVYFPRPLAWWLPLVTLTISDLALNLYYQSRGVDAFQPSQLLNYVAFALIIWLGTKFRPQAVWLNLISGGLVGAILFYLITNTAAWFFNPFHNPEYTRSLAGLWIALTKGTAGYPQTWEFFRNTLLSGGLFTGLFVGSMKLCEHLEASEDEQEPKSEDEQNPEHGQAKA